MQDVYELRKVSEIMKELFQRVFTVHKCVSCRKILKYENFDDAFCPSCYENYLSARMAICPECSLEAEKCRCMPPLLNKDKVISLRKLFFYSKNKATEPQNRLIYYLKRNKSRRACFSISKDILLLINAELARLDVEQIPLLIGVPRSRGAFFEYGFDQADMLCRAISERCGLEYSTVIKRRRGGKAQKSLTAGERLKNIKSLIYADKNGIDEIRGRTVILLDDVVTTGASMSACVHILRECGAKNIICVALATDIKS